MTKTATQANLIRTARERAGLGVVALAREIDKSPTFISRVESGQIKVTHPETIASLAHVLDLHPDDLYIAGGLIPHDIRDAVKALTRDRLRALRAFLGIDLEDEP